MARLSIRWWGAVALAVALASTSVANAAWPRPAAGASTTGQPEIVFTFDDGPHRQYTPQVLDQLAKHGIQAMFFWVGHRTLRDGRIVTSSRRIIERAVREGHLIGTHTDNHVHLCRMSMADARREIEDPIELYRELTGLPMNLFRAPYGDHCPSLVALLEDRNLRHMHWDMDPQEWVDHDPQRTVDYLIGKLKHLDGRGVILLHDTKWAAVTALPAVLQWLDTENARRRSEGRPEIRVVPPSELFAEAMDPGIRGWVTSLVTRTANIALRTANRLVPGTKPTTTAQLQ